MELDRTTALLWEGRSTPRRGPKPSLSIQRIAEAAVAIADADGLGAMSMQSVGERLGFTKMSLYRYVASRDELVAVMVEAAVGEAPATNRRLGWRRRMENWAEGLVATWHDHPWLPWATVGSRAMGPREVAWVESALDSLSTTRLTAPEQIDAVFLLFGHLRNTQSTQTAGTQPWNDPGQMALLRRDADRFPTLAALNGTTQSLDVSRAFGMARILDGIDALHRSRSKTPHQ